MVRKLTFILAIMAGTVPASDSSAETPITLHDASARAGIAFTHTDGGSGRRYIVEYVSAGLALFDYDGDGDEDIYFLNGAPLAGTHADTEPRNALYRNDGGFRFTDVTVEAGVGDTGHGLGVTAGDYDNDGHLDLYLNNFGPNVLYRNQGDGTFRAVSDEAGVVNGDRVGAGVCFLDFDGDGDLDLYVSNYVCFSYDMHTPRTLRGYSVYPSPLEYAPDPDTVYRNNGDGTFTDVSQACGVGRHPGTGMGMVCADYDGDGDTDVLVGNDVMANFLFQNDGDGNFTEVGMASGLAFDMAGIPHGSMGIDCGDYDNDELLDFFVTSYQHELATLYRNWGNGLFEDVTRRTGAGKPTRRHVTWGTGLVDFDNDGDRDIFIACGHFDDNVERRDDTTAYAAPNLMLMNVDGRFEDVSDKCGDGLGVRLSSRGAVFGDLDNDGDIDCVILNSRRRPTLLRNDSENDHHWLRVSLQGVGSNRNGVGARVKVVAGDLTLVDEVHSGRSYQSHFGTRLHFGLGRHDRVDRIEVRWVGGAVQQRTDVPVDGCVTIVEGAK